MNEKDSMEDLIVRLRRSDIPAIERARAYQRLRDAGYSCAEIGSFLRFTKRHVEKQLKLLTLAPEVIGALEAGNLFREHALVMASGSMEDQRRALPLILKKAPGWRTAQEIKSSIEKNLLQAE